MTRLALLLALGACGPSRPSTGEQAPAPGSAAPAPAPALAAPAPAPAAASAEVAPPPVATSRPDWLASEDVVRKLQEIGRRRKGELSRPAEDRELISALGPCRRPGAAERVALRKRVLAWINQTNAATEYPEDEAADLDLRFGCLEPAGIVVAARMDRETRRQKRMHAPDLGHWWTLRVRETAITALSETTGLATIRYGEWAQERWEETVALADLDGDDVLDPVVAQVDHEGGAMISAIQLSVVASRTNERTPSASFEGEVAAARVQRAGRGGPIVLDIEDRAASLHALRCVDATLALTRCPEAAATRWHAAVLEVAEQLSVATTVPDREQLATWLEMLGVARDAAAPLLAAARPTSPEDRAARKIARFVRRPDDLTNVEYEAAQRRETAAAALALERDLGVSTCDRTSADEEARVRDTIAAAAPGALDLSVPAGCGGPHGGYVAARWRIREQRYEALYFVQGDQVKQVMKAGPAPRFDPSGPAPPPPLLGLGVYRRGDAAIALVLTPQPSGDHQLTAIVDGAVIGRRTGSLTFDGNAVIQDQGTSRRRYLHATATAITEVAAFDAPSMRSTAPTGGPAAKRLFEREQKLAARSLLESATSESATSAWLSDPARRADAVRALQLLGADRALVDEISHLRSGTAE